MSVLLAGMHALCQQCLMVRHSCLGSEALMSTAAAAAAAASGTLPAQQAAAAAASANPKPEW